ncbi:MAG: hypothetical protein M3Z20_13950, partial [Chloroflexota bacterium]|nr:hypothetical protein [Chloroflexota bacterium]
MIEDTEIYQDAVTLPAQPQPEAGAAFASGLFAPSTWLARTFDILSPLWVAGVAVVVVGFSLLPAAVFVSRGSRLGVWIPYLALGTVFPAAVFLVLASTRSGHPLAKPLQRVLIVLAFGASVAVARPAHILPALGLAAVQTAVCAGLLSTRSIQFSVALMAVSTSSWLLMLKLFAWDPMPAVYPVSWPLLAIGSAALVSCCWWAFHPGTAQDRRKIPADALAMGLLILLAFRTDGLFQTDRVAPTGSFYHWGAAVGPAEAIRQGGVLLWDTPSPYGFLLPLSMAAFPAPTVWQSLYVLNAIFTAMLAIAMYWAIRLRSPGVKGALLSLLLSSAVIYFVAMYPPQILPEHFYPMGGAFRYAWSYLLVGILLVERFATESRKTRDLVLVAGSVCWLISALWSTESAFFGTMIWI